MHGEPMDRAAAAFAAAAALDRYASELEFVIAARETGARLRLGPDLQRVRTALVALPALWPAWLLVLISHYELLDALDRGEARNAVSAALQQHAERVNSVATVCRRMCSPAG